jgi:hypothetical protein
MSDRQEGRVKEQYAQVRHRIDALTKKLEQERAEERPLRGPSARVVARPPASGSREAVFIKLAVVLAAAVAAFIYFWLHR